MRTKRRLAESDKRIIAWDGEGIKLRGANRPQNYVLFGCSADVDNPLQISSEHDDLDFVRLADYMCDISDAFPNARHVGYFFGYDQNMIVKSLPWMVKHAIYEHGSARYRTDTATYRITIKFGKQIRIIRERDGRRSSVTVDDMGPFFASSFVKAYESMFADHVDDPDWQTVVSGKLARGGTTWSDLAEVRRYWEIEIRALERLATFFRDLMFEAGFPLTEWYGPGALAKKIRQLYRLGEHEHGGKEANIPPEVHHAAKSAFYGGHFEQYIVGRIRETVYGYDIRSAYPFAFTQVPSLREGGFWQRVDKPGQDCAFGVYYVRYQCPNALTRKGYPIRGVTEPQPLPWRNADGEVVYSTIVEGWYWRPEVDMVRELYPERVEIVEGWEWRPADDSRPWADVLLPMFERRRELKAVGDPCQMAFKLGPNSLYGKMAQRTGWDVVNSTPPRSHTLSLAGFITSYCRALIMRVVHQIPATDLIAVETDGIYCTTPPDSLDLPNGIGPELGQWEVESFDEMMYVQNGLYLARSGDAWSKVKTRGIRRDQIQPDSMASYLDDCGSDGAWIPLELSAGERFTGLGAAISRSRNHNGQVVPPKASALHCRWTPDVRKVVPGGMGKRSHASRYCHSCKAGMSAGDGPHYLAIATPVGMAFPGEDPSSVRSFSVVSTPYQLPWEKGYTVPGWLESDIIDSHSYTAENLYDTGGA